MSPSVPYTDSTLSLVSTDPNDHFYLSAEPQQADSLLVTALPLLQVLEGDVLKMPKKEP